MDKKVLAEKLGILQDMAASIREKIQEHGLKMEEIAGVGVDVVGISSEKRSYTCCGVMVTLSRKLSRS